MAINLIPDVAYAILAADLIKLTIQKHEHGMALVTPSTSTWDSAVERMSFGIEGDRVLMREAYVLPPEVALKVVFLFRSIEDFDEMIATWLPQCRGFDGEMRTAFTGDVDKKFGTIDRMVRDLGKELAEIADIPQDQIRALAPIELKHKSESDIPG